MHQRQVILFDLDGTLTNPGEGIINSLRYALEHYQIEGDPNILARFIGPPLIDSFQKYYKFSEETAREAIALYRERFHAEGVLQNEVYPGIPELLAKLKEQGKTLAVATTKPTIYARQVLEHFRLDGYFAPDLVVGSFLDGKRTDKGEIIGVVLERLENKALSKVMVGDTTYDINGARKHNLETISVTYGYGIEAELIAANPARLVPSVAALTKLLVGK